MAVEDDVVPKLSHLIATISRFVRIPEKEVALYARRLREDGLLPQSSGRSHPDVDHRDCARLLTALLVTDVAREAPDGVRAYEPLVDRLAEILADADWAAKIESVRVNRNNGEMNILDSSAKASKPGWFSGRRDGPPQDRSLIEVIGSLPGNVLSDVAMALKDNHELTGRA